MITQSTIRGKFPTKSLGTIVEFLDSKRRPITAKDRVPGPYPYYGANGLQDILPHLGHAALAEQHAVSVAGNQIEDSLKILDTDHDAGSTPQWFRYGRIVRMEGDADPDFLGHRHHAPQKVLEIFPQPFLRNRQFRIVRRWILQVFFVVE